MMSLLSFSRFQSSWIMYIFFTFLSVILLSMLGVCCSVLAFLFDYLLWVSQFQVVLILLMCVYIYFIQSFLIKWVWYYLIDFCFIFTFVAHWRLDAKLLRSSGHSSKSGIGCWFNFIVINFCFPSIPLLNFLLPHWIYCVYLMFYGIWFSNFSLYLYNT